MRKLFDPKTLDVKIGPVRDTVTEVRGAARQIGDAAESQATLNIALTAVCCCSLLIAALLVHSASRGQL